MAKPIFGVKPPEWWKHLKWQKAFFWDKVRIHNAKEIKKEVEELQSMQALENTRTDSLES